MKIIEIRAVSDKADRVMRYFIKNKADLAYANKELTRRIKTSMMMNYDSFDFTIIKYTYRAKGDIVPAHDKYLKAVTFQDVGKGDQSGKAAEEKERIAKLLEINKGRKL